MLPNASLLLTKATPDERVRTWLQQQPHWGPSFTPQAYVSREERLLNLRLTKDGGLTIWALTHEMDVNDTSDNTDDVVGSDGASQRPILSSLEVFRKRAIVRGTDGIVRDVTAHAVASVFTAPENRRKGYSSKMLSLLGDELAQQQAQDPGSAEFSVLFSDIGKTFYAQQQWMPFPSTHLSFSVSPLAATTTTTTATHDDRLTLITDDNLPAVAALDEETLREKLARPPQSPSTVRVAILPDLATYEWQLTRAAILANLLLGRAPTTHGALYNPPGRPNSRVWMLWSPAVPGGRDAPDKNTFYILHLALEDPALPDDALSAALAALMTVARTQAEEWLCPKIDMWNPDDRLRVLMQQAVPLPSELVVRETTSIASLRWFGDGPVSDVEWVDNHKFEWC
ncbi:hypothetical protein E4U42_004215 [Claviceps africana]|uniref:LYC1 C-terminal domain-containing protein n=1 Tax=Claviceps africana TaxID=83212 RepID=A0A8K0J6M1_9HYPO|nr:hypothetical protein E4U42_004215 [Claviceps africana]